MIYYKAKECHNIYKRVKYLDCYRTPGYVVGYWDKDELFTEKELEKLEKTRYIRFDDYNDLFPTLHRVTKSDFKKVEIKKSEVGFLLGHRFDIKDGIL